MAPTAPVFATAAPLYHAAGWPGIVPVPHESKWPPPTGYTGADGADTPRDVLQSWCENGFAGHSIALRFPDGIIGIDIDEYDKHVKGPKTGETRIVQKRGAATFAAAIEQWGELPPTWSSTARGPGQPSRILFYRCRPGRWAIGLGPDVDILQRHHRYAVVWPSVHSELGTVTRWYDPAGNLVDEGIVPRPEWLAELTPRWELGLSQGATAATPMAADHASGELLLAMVSTDDRPECSEMVNARDTAVRETTTADIGTRHDVMLKRVHRMIQLAAWGHGGFAHNLPHLRQRWDELTPGENRGDEFDKLMLSSARKGVTAIGGICKLSDPCNMAGGARWAQVPPPAVAEQSIFGGVYVPPAEPVDATPHPADYRDPNADDFEPLPQLPPKLVDPSWTEVIGADPFIPDADMDQPVADAMLVRVVYMVRRAADLKAAWLQRGAQQWELVGDLSGRIVKETVDRMPTGDPSAPAKGDPPTAEQRMFARKKRFSMNAGAAAAQASIKRATDGGRHPLTVRIVDLDRDPEVLWGGGWPWDLRASGEVPTVAARIDPHGPHLCAAGVMPDPRVPTPRWDAFIAAVWPDPAVRAWALRVLSIAFTGYADAALPILFGSGGTGKTSIAHLMMQLLGSYACAADPALLGDKSNGFHVFALKGIRFAFIDEAMRESKGSIEILKQLTGGGPMTGSLKHQDGVTFDATHTLGLTSNTPPTVTDQAIRRRLRLLPCDGDVDEVRIRRRALTGVYWAAEAPGVLAAMMRETTAWLAHPDTTLLPAAPLQIQALMGELLSQQDVIMRWVDDATVPANPGTSSHALYVAFRVWCREAGIRDTLIPTETAWGRALTDLGYPMHRVAAGKLRPLTFRHDGGFHRAGAPLPMPSGNTPDRVIVYPQVSPSVNETPAHEGTNTANGMHGSTENMHGRAQLDPELYIDHNRRSDPGSEIPDVQLYSSSSPYTSEEERDESWGSNSETTHTVHQQEGGTPETPPLTSENSACTVGEGNRTSPPVPGVSPSDTPENQQTQPRKPALTSTNAVDLDLGVIHSLGITLDPSRKVSVPEVQQVAEALGVRRPEARTLIKTAARAAAIEQACGQRLPLPVLVDRDGNLTPCPVGVAVARVMDATARSGALTVDVEHTGYPVGHRFYALRTVQLGDAWECAVFDPTEHAEAITALLDAAPALSAHSAQADIVPLAYAGLVDPEAAWAKTHDTVIPAKLSDPGSTGSDPALKKFAPAVLGAAAVTPGADEARKAVFTAAKWLTDTEVDTPLERSGWAQIPANCTTMLRYAGSDVLDTAAIAGVLSAHMPPPAVYDRERLAQRMTARVTLRGVRLDREHIGAKLAEHEQGLAQRGAAVRAFGIDNPGSDQQLATLLTSWGVGLPRTAPSSKFPDGQPSVAAGVLEAHEEAPGAVGELVRQVLGYRHHETALGLFLRPYRALCDHGDGRARPTIYTLGTNTGRMSAVRPNLQQLPRAGGMRACLTADPGHLMISADFSGVELRVAAALSQDPTLLQFLRDNRNLHEEVALLVYGPDPVRSAEKGRPVATVGQYYRVKRGVFGWLYGGGAPTLARQMGAHLDVAQRMIDTLNEMVPQLVSWTEWVRGQVRAGHTQFPTYSGRVIHLDRSLPHKGPNFVIQGTAKEILNDALVAWDKTKWRMCTLMPVHDELDIFVPEAEAQDAIATLVECMRTELHGVAIVADPAKGGPAWAWPDSE